MAGVTCDMPELEQPGLPGLHSTPGQLKRVTWALNQALHCIQHHAALLLACQEPCCVGYSPAPVPVACMGCTCDNGQWILSLAPGSRVCPAR